MVLGFVRGSREPNPRRLGINNPGFWPVERRIAVTGLSGSGKTVFLTSLICHLLHHDPTKFDIGRQVQIVRPRPIRPRGTWPEFPYEVNRANLATGEWPEKTRQCTEYIVDFYFSHWRLRRTRLRIFDVPGERLADCNIRHNAFSQWSDEQIRLFKSMCDKPAEVKDFLELCEVEPTSEVDLARLILSYKKALVEWYNRFHKYLSPSTFILDLQGRQLCEEAWWSHWDPLRDCERGERLSQRYCGLPGSEFAPLGARCQTTRQLAANYCRYKREVVNRLFNMLARCDSLAVLSDIAHILQSGPDVCDEAQDFVEKVLNALNPGIKLPIIGKIPIIGRIAKRQIARIAFAASQADRFHSDDKERVKELLKELILPVFGDYRGATKRHFLVSAVRSAYSDEKANLLLRPGVRDTSQSRQVARIPDDWDYWHDDWDAKKLFRDQGGFPKLPPYMPPRRRAAPEQYNLDLMFRFLFGPGLPAREGEPGE